MEIAGIKELSVWQRYFPLPYAQQYVYIWLQAAYATSHRCAVQISYTFQAETLIVFCTAQRYQNTAITAISVFLYFVIWDRFQKKFHNLVF
jgi:hypothetical protein